jgi:hypothetical protein
MLMFVSEDLITKYLHFQILQLSKSVSEKIVYPVLAENLNAF